MLEAMTEFVHLRSRWRLALKMLPIVMAIVLMKLVIHRLDYEFLTLNSLFTAIISADIFLIGFLISGTLVDYKESEKLPGDLSASIESMADEGLIIYENKTSDEAKRFLLKLARFNESLIDWFHKKAGTEDLMNGLLSFNEDYLAFETQTQANFIARLKQEQNSIRKIINRIQTIRETSFLGAGYAIAEIITCILVIGLIFIRMEPFHESIFFVSFVSFILIYMIYFIKDLDNPFGYDETGSFVDEVSLKPIFESKKRIASYCQRFQK